MPSSTPTPHPPLASSSAEKNDGGESTVADGGAWLDTGSIGRKSPFQAGDITGQNNNGKDKSPVDLLQGYHHQADLDFHDEFDATTTISDHSEL